MGVGWNTCGVCEVLGIKQEQRAKFEEDNKLPHQHGRQWYAKFDN